MKILHTADWHLGAKTEGKSRIDEQRKVMAEIVSVAESEKVDLVIVAGDVFDQSVPTSEAEDLFYETMESLSKDNARVVVVIAGNHDDPKRLTAGEHFAKKHNVILAGDLNPVVEPGEFKKGKILPSAPGSVEIEVKKPRGVERCVVAMLPYPAEYRFQESSNAPDYEGKVKEWARRVAKGFKKDSFNILATHLMLVGSSANINGEQKVLRVGDVNAISKSELPGADYYALGHIHSYQNMKGNFCYSGSPLAYDFKQRSTGVVILETKGRNGIKDIKFVELLTPATMKEIEVRGIDEAENLLKEFGAQDIINLTFVQNEPLNMAIIKKLKQDFPCLVKVLLRMENVQVDEKNYVCNRNKMEAGNLFVEFYKQKKLAEPTRELVALFKEMMEEKVSETN